MSARSTDSKIDSVEAVQPGWPQATFRSIIQPLRAKVAAKAVFDADDGFESPSEGTTTL